MKGKMINRKYKETEKVEKTLNTQIVSKENNWQNKNFLARMNDNLTLKEFIECIEKAHN